MEVKKGRLEKKNFEKKFVAVVVEDEWNMLNGLVDLNRDVLMKLVKLILDCEKIRNVIGMTGIFCDWRKQRIFRWARETSFRLNPKGEIKIQNTTAGVLFSFTATHRTIFVENIIITGIFRWTVKIFYGANGSFRLGAAPPQLVPLCDAERLGDFVHGTCAFQFWRSDFFTVKAGLVGVRDIGEISTVVAEGSLVAVEVDVEGRTLSFFVGEKKVPHVLSVLRFPVHLGLTASYFASFASVAFRRLRTATESSTECSMHKCIGL